MKSGQTYTPKYWMGHSKLTDEVYLDTASKTLADTENLMDEIFSYDWRDDPNVEITVFSIDFAEGFKP